jgi:hypothetical protein
MRKLLIVSILCGITAVPCFSKDLKREPKQLGIQGSTPNIATLGVVVNIQPSVSLSVVTERISERDDTGRRFRTPLASTPGLPEDEPDPGLREGVTFYATGGPDAYFASNRVVLVVSTNLGGWGILCQASPLTSEHGEILGDRVFARSDYTDSKNLPDEGAGVGFVSLGAPRVVGVGSETEQLELALDFKLLTDYSDRAGNYAGTIVFSYMAAP